jgi:DNA-directed RNA polymerase subunit N (RpoN/RPB10)
MLAHKWEAYLNKIQLKYSNNEVDNMRKERFIQVKKEINKSIEGVILDELEINDYCCRKNFLAHVELTDKV